MVDTVGAFIQAATTQPPHAGFKAVINRMMLENGEIDQAGFDKIGEVQARTVVIAAFAEHGTPEQIGKILGRFGGRNRDESLSNVLDLNRAMFGLQPATAVEELDAFIAELNIESVDDKINKALESVRAEKGVHPNAASSVVITKALYFAEYEKAAIQKIFDGALIMQLSMRSLERAESFLAGTYNRDKALELLQTSNKLSYKFDHKDVVRANEALLNLCTIEMQTDSALQRGEPMDEVRALHESSAKRNIETLIKVMPTAASLFESNGKPELGAKVREVHAYYSARYQGILDVPHIMMMPGGKTGYEQSGPKL